MNNVDFWFLLPKYKELTSCHSHSYKDKKLNTLKLNILSETIRELKLQDKQSPLPALRQIWRDSLMQRVTVEINLHGTEGHRSHKLMFEINLHGTEGTGAIH